MTNSISSNLNKLSLKAADFPDGNILTDDFQTSIQSLIERGKLLHDEVEAYVAAVLEKQKFSKVYNPVEYRGLRNDMRNELAFLNKIISSNMDEEKARHYIASSNLLYYEALWSTAKRSIGLQSFRKYFFWDRHKVPGGKGAFKGLSLAKGSHKRAKTAALVDIVAEEGMKWIRVSTVSEKRLLFDLAKLGWMNDSDSDTDLLDAGLGDEQNGDDEDEVDVVRNARDLARAAKANPIHGRPPKVHFVLTRIEFGKTQAVDMIINKIRATGAVVQCSKEIPPPVPLESVLNQLLVDRSRAISETVNIDCTILLALISDISHKPCPILDWYPGEVKSQIQEEAKEYLLPSHLYPAIGSHPMVCTKEAADQMNLIVETLATDTEKLRANLLLAQGDRQGHSPTDLAEEWASISDHTIPGGFQLPIRVKEIDLHTITDGLPAVAAKVAEELGALNKSIFVYGWANSLTTLSSNRGRVRQIDHIINEYGLQDGETGPHIWVCGESRSLIAKQGRRK